MELSLHLFLFCCIIIFCIELEKKVAEFLEMLLFSIFHGEI